MPTLQLKVSPEPTPQLKARLAAELTGLTHDVLGKRAEVTAVMVETLPFQQWFIAGEAVSQPTAWLEISITQGTNTAAQKEAFIQQAHALLQRTLGAEQALAEASYVLVRELPASDWGYAGRTQLSRQRERATAL